MTGTALTLTVTFLSDWHIGTGAGIAGSIDRLQARDGDGLPFVPAKTLTGMLRDSAEQLAAGLGTPWPAWVERLFGDQPSVSGGGDRTAPPAPALLTVGAAHIAAPLRDLLRQSGYGPFRDWMTVIRPSVAVDSGTGAAKAEHLRFTEMGRSGLILTGTATLDAALTSDQVEVAKALLAAAAALTERIGGKRRRGGGRCRVEVAELTAQEAAKRLRTRRDPSPEAPAAARLPCPSTPLAGADAPSHGGWYRLPLSLVLEEPLCVAAAVVGNLVETMDHIPGTMLIPVIGNWLTRRFGEAGPAFESLLLGGRLRVLNATPDLGGGRARPAPFTLRIARSAIGRDRLSEVRNLLCDPTPPEEGERGLNGAWLSSSPLPVSGGTVTRLPGFLPRVPRVQFTHSAVDDGAQRPRGIEQDGSGPGLYSMEAIAAGCRFGSELLLYLTDEELKRLPNDWHRLDERITLGRARKGGYGGTRLTCNVAAPIPARPPAPVADAAKDSVVTLWCLSDMALRDEGLRPTTSLEALRIAFERRLKVAVPDARVELDGTGAAGWAARPMRRDGWHARGGWPRETLAGLAGGSVVRFRVATATPDSLAGVLSAIEAEGLGERRAEGFGDIVFDDPLTTRSMSGVSRGGERSDPCRSLPRRVPALQAPEDDRGMDLFRLARRLERKQWEARILDRAEALAADAGKRAALLGFTTDKGKSRPSLSQLGELRALLEAGDPVPIDGFLERKRRDGRKDGEWARTVDAIPTWLKPEDKSLWAILDENADWPILTEGGVEHLQEALRRHAVHALCVAAIRAQEAMEKAGRSVTADDKGDRP